MTERHTPKIFYQLPLAFDEPPDQIIPRGRRGRRRARVVPVPEITPATGDEDRPPTPETDDQEPPA